MLWEEWKYRQKREKKDVKFDPNYELIWRERVNEKSIPVEQMKRVPKDILRALDFGYYSNL